jgi:transposase
MNNGETLPARRGRPSKAEQVLTPEILERAAALLLEGHHKETVADFLGIHRATWWRWEQIGEREPETIYGDFCNVTRAAIAGAEIDAIRTIRAGRPDWPARAWLAERRFPQRWGKRVEITVRREAERLAAELGVSADELIADAQKIAEEMASR